MAVSVNPFTKKIHTIPKKLDDSNRVEEFLLNNQGKKVVVVQGLGFVGAVMSLVCANALSEEYAVIGVDLANENTYWKIKSINEGVFPLVASDPKIPEFFERAQDKGNLLATYDPTAYKYADVIIVDINLDVQKELNQDGVLGNFDVDLNEFKSAITSIGQNCTDDVLVLVETTVPPGTCENVVKPIIESQLLQRGLSADNYRLGHSYERVMPGPEYIDSIREFPRVYSGINEVGADAVETFDVSIFGMANTVHEKVYKNERKLDFVAEFYADLDYDKEGRLVIAKGKNSKYDSKLAVKRCLRAISEKKVKNTSGTDTDVGCDTICVHSDTPNAVEIIKSLKKALKK